MRFHVGFFKMKPCLMTPNHSNLSTNKTFALMVSRFSWRPGDPQLGCEGHFGERCPSHLHHGLSGQVFSGHFTDVETKVLRGRWHIRSQTASEKQPDSTVGFFTLCWEHLHGARSQGALS